MKQQKKKLISNLIVILIIGGLGGIIADRFLFPYLAGLPYLGQTAFIKKLADRTTVIRQTEEIVIKEETALERAIGKVNPSLVGIETQRAGRILTQGTGFIVTGDGLIITASQVVGGAADKYYVFFNGDRTPAELIRKDLKTNLALLKAKKSNLTVVSMKEQDGLSLGERVALVGWDKEQKFANAGIIKKLTEEMIFTNMEENDLASGSPLINMEGKVIGLNLIDNGQVEAIGVDTIKSFLNL